MKTKILIEKEWKYFFNLIGNEILVQLNQKTKEAEFVLPASYAVFGNNKERYKIENGDLVVLEKQKVYARELANSFVDTAYPIVKNLDSYVQILQFLESANAKKLNEKAKTLARARQSLIEELDAINVYEERIQASDDEKLKVLLAHNRDEEKEHAAMLIDWLRENDPTFDKKFIKA